MQAPYWLGLRDPDLRLAVHRVWERLPADAQQALSRIDVVQASAIKAHDGSNGWGQAGPADILLRPGVPSAMAAMGIFVHEAAHVVLQHPQRLTAGLITRAAAEQEADAFAAGRWGFHAEIAARRMLIGV